MNRIEILNSIRKLAKSPDLWPQIRAELSPALRKFRPKSFEALTNVGPMKEADIVKGYRGVHDTFPDRTSTISLREVEPFSENINTDTKTVLHELWHEKQIRNTEFSRDLKQGEISRVFDQDKEGLAYPDYTGIRTKMHNPAEMTAEVLARQQLAPESLSRLPEAVRKKAPKWHEKYRVLPLTTAATGGAVASGYIDPDESQAAVSMKEPAKLAKTAVDSLKQNWAPEDAINALLKGKVWKDKIITGVYKPRIDVSKYSASHPISKLYGGDKRVITFKGGSYINADKDDLQTIITRYGLGDYMEKYDEATPKVGKLFRSQRSVENREWFKNNYDTLYAARGMRKKNARHQVDLFGEMLTPVETIKFKGKYYNIPEPYTKHLKGLVEEVKANPSKFTREQVRESMSYEFFGDNETTFFSKYDSALPKTVKGQPNPNIRDWTTPENWEKV